MGRVGSRFAGIGGIDIVDDDLAVLASLLFVHFEGFLM